MVKLPTTTLSLVHTFYYLIKKLRVCQSWPAAVHQTFLRFGNVSSRFNSILVDAFNYYLVTDVPEFYTTIDYCYGILGVDCKFVTNFLDKYTDNNLTLQVSIDDIFDYTDKVSFLELGGTNYESLVGFFKSSPFPNVIKFDCSTSVLRDCELPEVVSLLPKLQYLCVQLRVTGECALLSPSLSNLIGLSVSLTDKCSRHLNVSNLENLVEIFVNHFHSLFGLEHCHNLKRLFLTEVYHVELPVGSSKMEEISTTNCHGSISKRLLNSIETKYLTKFSSQYNSSTVPCFCIQKLPFFSKLKSASFQLDGSITDVISFPFVESLSITSITDSPVFLYLGDLPCIKSLKINGHIVYSNTPYRYYDLLETLEFQSNDVILLIYLLQCCRFLTDLVLLEPASPFKILRSQSNFELNYLRNITIKGTTVFRQTSELLSIFPSMPRMKILIVHNTDYFDLSLLPLKFPNLKKIHIEDSKFVNSVSRLISIEKIIIKSCKNVFLGFSRSFPRLLHLELDLKPCKPTGSFKFLLLPVCLRYFRYYGPITFIQDSFPHMKNLSMFSVTVPSDSCESLVVKLVAQVREVSSKCFVEVKHFL
ncbi:hypothetical protein RCL1_002496 [Eukaryota sp. TZLM3-RCL]